MRAAIALCALFILGCSPSDSKPTGDGAIAQLPVSASSLGDACGGMVSGASQSCAGENEYCHYEIKDMCGAADAPGVCREKPQMCTMDYTPVCGCDEQTYSNECSANAKGVSAAYLGECK